MTPFAPICANLDKGDRSLFEAKVVLAGELNVGKVPSFLPWHGSCFSMTGIRHGPSKFERAVIAIRAPSLPSPWERGRLARIGPRQLTLALL